MELLEPYLTSDKYYYKVWLQSNLISQPTSIRLATNKNNLNYSDIALFLTAMSTQYMHIIANSFSPRMFVADE